MKRNMPTGPRPYHHGNLRAELVDLGIEQMRHKDVSALTLRGLALLAGVSPMAPAHHFGTRRGLLAAIAAEGFRRLREFREAFPGGSGNASGDVIAHVHACIAFAVEQPALFRLMFGPEFGDKKDFPELAAAAAQGYVQFNASVNRYFQLRGLPPPPGATAAVWAVMHGFAMLIMDQQSPPGGGVKPVEMVDQTLVFLLEGLASSLTQ